MNLFYNQGRLFQYLATLSGVFCVITSGINLGWTSPYLPQLLDPQSPIPTTSGEGSWCAIMPLVGAPVGAFVAAILTDLIGRKITTLLMTPVIVLSFVGIAFADSILLISIFRFAIGSSEGALFTVLPIYIAEISDPQIRGFLTSTVAIAGITGTLFVNVLGQNCSIFTSALICTGVPLIHFLTFIWMPESPYYYLKKKRYGDAERSLKILRGRNDVGDELALLQEAVARQEENSGANLKELVSVASNRKAWLIFFVVNATNKFSGKNPVMFYTTTIFQEAGSKISAELSVVVYCSVELVATMGATFMVDRFGRRPLLIVSSLGCTVSVLILGTYFYLKTVIPEDVASFDWLPITSLVVYNVLFSVGLAFGPVTIVSELFPTNVKSAAMGFADTFSVIMGALASKFFQITNDEFGMHVPFWCFGVCCAVGLVLIVKFVPETKGKTLEDIQRFLIGKQK